MHFQNANKTMSVHSIYFVMVIVFWIGIEGELGLIEFGKKDAMSVFFFHLQISLVHTILLMFAWFSYISLLIIAFFLLLTVLCRIASSKFLVFVHLWLYCRSSLWRNNDILFIVVQFYIWRAIWKQKSSLIQ